MRKDYIYLTSVGEDWNFPNIIFMQYNWTDN